MIVSDLIKTLRVAIDDVHSVRYSDYSFLDVVNTVFTNFTNLLNKHNSELLLKEVTLVMENDACVLPDDFAKLVSVTYNDEDVSPCIKLTSNGYKVVGSTIKSKLPSLDITYSCFYPDSFELASTVPFPAYLIEYLKKYIVMVLTNNNSDASITILPVMENDIVSLLSARGHAYVDRELPFRV